MVRRYVHRARPSAPKWPTSSSVIDQMSGASNALEARSADAIAPSAWAEGEMSPQDMEDVVLVIGIGAPLGRGGGSHQMRPIHQNIAPRRALPSPHSPRAHPPRTAVFIAAAGLIIARAAGCMGRSSGDEGKPLAEEGKAPRERRARANSNTAVQWQMH